MSQKTKSGQAPDDKPQSKLYKHAELLCFLDGKAVGLYGVHAPTTNAPHTSHVENMEL